VSEKTAIHVFYELEMPRVRSLSDGTWREDGKQSRSGGKRTKRKRIEMHSDTI
jgi:hypothetical protein